MDLQPAEGRELTSVDEIIAGIRSDRPMVSRTEFDQGEYQVCIEHPVKTINYSEEQRVPDRYRSGAPPGSLPRTAAEGRPPDRNAGPGVFRFQCPDWAEFIVNVPTPLGSGLSSTTIPSPAGSTSAGIAPAPVGVRAGDTDTGATAEIACLPIAPTD